MSPPTLNGDPAGRSDVSATVAAKFQLWFTPPRELPRFDAAILSAVDRRRFDAIHNPRRRQEFAISRALLADVAPPEPTALSLSHSGGLAALVAGPADVAIGVDLEQHRPRDVASIAQFAFGERESAALLALKSPQRERQFYRLWVMKEALAKALQLPLLEALRSCTFTRQDDTWLATIPTPSHWLVRVFEPQPGMSLAVACVGSAAQVLPQSGAIGIETCDWPPSRAARWPCVIALESTSRQDGCGSFPVSMRQNPQESSTCRAKLPTP
jgi:4'-phosphopantetheinyl transferase